MNKEVARAALLVELFETQDNLGRFVYSIPIQDPSVSRAIRAGSALGASTTERLALWFVDELRRRGLVDKRRTAIASNPASATSWARPRPGSIASTCCETATNASAAPVRPATPLFNTAAPAWRQQCLLAKMT